MTYRDFQSRSLQQYLTDLLENRSMVDAAREAGINRTYLYKLMDRAGMRRPRVRASWKVQGL
jgi:hypothetical protein